MKTQKEHKKATLMKWNKEELVDYILCLEHNINVVNESFDNQYNAGYRKQEWISVDERLPGDIGEYIVMIQGAVIPATLWYDPWEGVWHEYNRNLEYYVSHWMPLPEAPKMKGGGE